MEIEIESKRNNPLLNRTEVHFRINHVNEKTPNRNIIKTELAEKLNSKKENVIIDKINTSFGLQEITGYAKIYTSSKQAESIEIKYLIDRNKVKEKQTKKEEKTEDKKKVETPEDEKTPIEEDLKEIKSKEEDTEKDELSEKKE